ncbi:amino acid adenylation domain-containing protein [Nonomuraea angiospora]|uniref:amino acid adenylation domain-containing protein n=1 Tax=Nonomuraea angiospora TaxID=46172 RepID=UPI0037877F2E
MTTAEHELNEGSPLSPQQEMAWRMGARGRAERVVRSGLPIARDELVSRLEALVAAHEILRTRYVETAGPGLPVRVVDPVGAVSMETSPAGHTSLRAGELTVEHRGVPDGTVLVLSLPRLTVDRTSWIRIAEVLLAGAHAGAVPIAGEDAPRFPGDYPESPVPPVDAAAAPKPSAVLPFLVPAAGWDRAAEPETVSVIVEGPLLDRLRETARELAAGEEAILLAAWRALYARYTRNGDDQVLVVTDGRSAPGMKDVLGLLERPVTARLTVDPDAAFAVAVKASAETLATAAKLEHHVGPLAFAHADDLDRGPVLSFRYRRDSWAVPAEQEPVHKFEIPGVLHLDCARSPQDLSLTVAGTCARVRKADLVTVAEAFKRLLTDALTDHGRAVGVLRLTARRKPVVRRYERHKAVVHRFLEHAELDPGRLAVRCENEVLSYGELAASAAAVAAVLRDRGIRPGDRVAVLTPAAAETLAAMLGVWMAGAAFVPIDPVWPQERIKAIVRESAVPLAVTPGSTGVALPVPTVTPADRAGSPPSVGPVAAEGAAYVIFTSGTSGSPKGVVIGHDQLAHYTSAVLARLRLPNGAGFAAVSTLAADLSYTAIFPTLASGGCVHLVGVDVATNPDALADQLRAHPVSAMKLVPSHLSALLEASSDPRALLPDEALILGGEMLPRSLHARLRELAPHLRLFNHYGPTETTIGASCLPLDAETDERCASVPVGAGLGDNVLTVVDDEGNPLPPWCPGEVLISGPGVGLGYLAETRDGGSGFGARGDTRQYRSGDLGRLVPGVGVEIIGRLDDQVKLHGHRVQLAEIEALLNRQPGVSAGAVIARTDASGLVSHLDAYVTGQAPSIKDIQVALGRHLPAALIPTGWRILERLPLTRNGKLDRPALPPIESPRGEPGRPRDSVEQRLLVLWASVLTADNIYPEADFFDLGGHSLRAIKLISLVNNAFSCKLPMSAIFTARTVAAMADLIRRNKGQDSNVVPLRAAKGGPPIFCVHAGGGNTLSYWELARQLEGDRQILGVESWGLHGRPPQRDLPEMAAEYAAAIAARRDGPPMLIGWCFGGRMAFETAQALRGAGHEVAGLVLIDSATPAYEDGSSGEPLTESTLISRFAWHYEVELPSRALTYDHLLEAMRGRGHLPPTAGEDELRVLLDVYAANMTASERHFAEHPDLPTPDYPVTLIRAEPPGLPLDADRTWGWRSVVGPGLSLGSISADHHGIMRPPAVSDLAALIVKALDS